MFRCQRPDGEKRASRHQLPRGASILQAAAAATALGVVGVLTKCVRARYVFLLIFC